MKAQSSRSWRWFSGGCKRPCETILVLVALQSVFSVHKILSGHAFDKECGSVGCVYVGKELYPFWVLEQDSHPQKTLGELNKWPTLRSGSKLQLSPLYVCACLESTMRYAETSAFQRTCWVKHISGSARLLRTMTPNMFGQMRRPRRTDQARAQWWRLKGGRRPRWQSSSFWGHTWCPRRPCPGCRRLRRRKGPVDREKRRISRFG